MPLWEQVAWLLVLLPFVFELLFLFFFIVNIYVTYFFLVFLQFRTTSLLELSIQLWLAADFSMFD